MTDSMLAVTGCIAAIRRMYGTGAYLLHRLADHAEELVREYQHLCRKVEHGCTDMTCPLCDK